MSLMRDLELVERKVLPKDPSFRAISTDRIERLVNDARTSARAQAKGAFLLSMMRLLALPGNGHTRLIPNDAIEVVPLRFVSIGKTPLLRDARPDLRWACGGTVISVNGTPIGDIAAATSDLLAGTDQRRRVIGPILLAWPSALREMGFTSETGGIEYQIRTEDRQTHTLSVDPARCVPAATLYPRNEHGRAAAAWSPARYLEVSDFGQLGLLMGLPSFFDPSETRLQAVISQAADLIRSRPTTSLLIDVRGNTGGNFLKTLPLIDAILEGGADRRVGVLVDKFTFSAAIVFVAILQHRLGARLRVIGEEMGDGLTFYAEGGTIDLPASGAAVRYSTAFHDWAGGRIDKTTPEDIAREIVAVGSVELDQVWSGSVDDRELTQRFSAEILDALRS